MWYVKKKKSHLQILSKVPGWMVREERAKSPLVENHWCNLFQKETPVEGKFHNSMNCVCFVHHCSRYTLVFFFFLKLWIKWKTYGVKEQTYSKNIFIKHSNIDLPLSSYAVCLNHFISLNLRIVIYIAENNFYLNLWTDF